VGTTLISVLNWDERAEGHLDLEAVRARYQPVHHFRVQQGRSDAHTPFSSSGVARTYYVLIGQMEIQDGFSSYSIQAGQYVRLPEGTYTVSYPEPVAYVSVLELPEQVWAQEKSLYDTTFRPRLQSIDHRLVQKR
jgi:hypothetical protein